MIKKDAIIIGSGQAAKPLSLKLSEAGWETVMIEKSEADLGGTCLNTGCTPTKTLIASAKAMYDIKTASKHGIQVKDVDLDYIKTQKRKEAVIQDSKVPLKKRIANADNLTLVYGKATFKEEKIVLVTKENGTQEEYTAPYIFIDAGSRPNIPDINGLSDVKWYDSTGILNLKEIPGKLVVIGAGYIALELGQMFSRFGSEVTLIESGEKFLQKEDRDIADALKKILEDEGIRILVDVKIKQLTKSKNGITVKIGSSETTDEIEATHLLIATGRQSNADELQVEAAGITLDGKGFIKVNDKLETNVKNTFALGDINGGPQFTHIAYNDYVIVYENLIEKKDRSIKERSVPYCMYTDPQLGRIGISEEEAREKGIDFRIAKIEGSRITRGIETGSVQGPWKAVVDKTSGNVLGAAIISTEGGEIASVVQMAMEGGLTAEHLSKAIFSHPSYAESLNTLFLELEK